MNYSLDTELIDQLCIDFRMFADTIEKLVMAQRVTSHYHATIMAERVAEARQQLNELISVREKAGLDAARTTTVMNLINRYQGLEGVLKEIRNDLGGGASRSRAAAEYRMTSENGER